MPGIGIISNANARINKKYPILNKVIDVIVGRRGELVQTFTLEDLNRASKEFLDYKLDLIVIYGGDGTIHKSLEALVKVVDDASKIPPVLLLPAGTMNTIPSSFGIQGHPLYNLLITMTMYRHNIPLRTLKRNIMKVNEYAGFLFGIGGPVEILKLNYSEGKTRHGSNKLLFEYFMSAFTGGDLIKTLLNPIHFKCRFDDGELLDYKMHTVFASFVENLPFHWTFFPRAGWYKDHFDVLFLDYKILQGLKGIFPMWTGTTHEFDGFHRYLPGKMEMFFDKPVDYQLDGEIYAPTDHFLLESGPELEIVVPPSLVWFNKHVKKRMGKVGPWQKLLFT